MIARPADFGFMGLQGKYTPWNDPAGHARFKKDISRMIELALRGEAGLLMLGAEQPGGDPTPLALPAFSARDIKGAGVDSSTLAGKVVVVDFWAPWCAPCGPTLEHLGELQSRLGEKLVVLAVSVQAGEKEVREFVASLKTRPVVLLGTDELAESFGGVVAVPTTLVFDNVGKRAAVFYGAPEGLGAKLDELLKELIEEPSQSKD